MKLPAPVSRRLRQAIREVQASDPRLRRLQRRLQRSENSVARLDARVTALAAELVDARRQGRRAAELADLVIELLSNEASRRDPEFVKILERYLSA